MMLRWYLLYCKGRKEQLAQLRFEALGLDSFLPQHDVEALVRHKRQVRTEPLFPNYLFVRFDPHLTSFQTIRSTSGVVRFVSTNGEVRPVETALVVALRCRSQQGHSVEIEAPVAGDTVRILEGPYAHLEAIFQQPLGEDRSQLLLEFLSRPAYIDVENKHFGMQS